MTQRYGLFFTMQALFSFVQKYFQTKTATPRKDAAAD